MSKDTKSPPLSFKQISMIVGLVALFIAGIAGVFMIMFRGEPESAEEDSTPPREEQTDIEEIDDVPALQDVEYDDPYVDDREALSETALDDALKMAMNLAYEGEWLEMANYIEPYELKYNLEESEKGEHLRGLYVDASALVQLTSLGDSPDSVDRAVKLLPTFETEELYVLGLYYLPRNVLLEMSIDHLALAPSQRGHVQLTERIDMHFTNPDGSGNDLESTDEKIASYLNMTRLNEFEEGFVRFNVQNGPIEEYVYVVHLPGGEFNLMGFYSDDTNPANTTETVSHHLDFREDVSKGIEALLHDAQDAYVEQRSDSSEGLDPSDDDSTDE